MQVDRELAEHTKGRALEAIKCLNSIFSENRHKGKEGFEAIHKGVGLSIGRIEMEVLGPIYTAHPDLDDLE